MKTRWSLQVMLVRAGVFGALGGLAAIALARFAPALPLNGIGLALVSALAGAAWGVRVARLGCQHAFYTGPGIRVLPLLFALAGALLLNFDLSAAPLPLGLFLLFLLLTQVGPRTQQCELPARKSRPHTLMVVAMALAVVLAACGQQAPASPGPDIDTETPAETETPPAADRSASALKALLDQGDLDWAQIEELAKGSTVRFYAWGGDPNINRWLDGYVAATLREQYQVILEFVPSDAHVFVNQLVNEIEAGRDPGSIDLMWINGENFRLAKAAGALFGPFVEQLPNARQYVNLDDPTIQNDFGVPVEGYEAPWGRAQFVMIYDAAKVPEPPRTLEALAGFVKANPGRFTYPAPPDFTGSAFVRTLLYAAMGGYDAFLNADPDDPATQAAMLEAAAPLWAYLRDLSPHLWQQGQSYPATLGQLHELYANGDVWLTMAYGPNEAAQKVEDGQFPESTRTFVFDSGTLANTHFLAIAGNAENAAGALVVANFLLSPAAQLSKYDLNNWGDLPVLDPSRLPADIGAQLAEWPRHDATLPVEVLEAHRIPELPAGFVDLLEEAWQENVLRATP